MLKLELRTDNDAFNPSSAEEIARILRQIAALIEMGHTSGAPSDINGNRCGFWEITE